MVVFILSVTVQSGDNSTLRVEIDDPAVQAIEFLLFDEARNKW
jgi:alpha-glucan,water dikinase